MKEKWYVTWDILQGNMIHKYAKKKADVKISTRSVIKS